MWLYKGTARSAFTNTSLSHPRASEHTNHQFSTVLAESQLHPVPMAPKAEKKPVSKKPVEEEPPTEKAEKAPAGKKPKAEKRLPAGKSAGKEGGDKKGKNRSKKNVETYKIYIFKVPKQVHPDIGTSSKVNFHLCGFRNPKIATLIFFAGCDIIKPFVDLVNPKSADCVHYTLPEISWVEVKQLEPVGVIENSYLVVIEIFFPIWGR
jgi:hypothetical protein